MIARIATYTAIGQWKPSIAFSKYRLDTSDTSKVMTAPQAAPIGSVGCGCGCGAGIAAWPVQARPSQNLTPA